MSLKFKLLAATATLALSVSSVSANEVTFEQSSQSGSTASIGKVVFYQTTGQLNTIGRGASDKFKVVGSLTDLVILQGGTAPTPATVIGNVVDMDVYTSDDGAGSINMEFFGDKNDFDMDYGTSSDTNFSTIDIEVDVNGSSNTIKEVIAQTETSFAYVAIVGGSSNAIDTTSAGNVTTLEIHYEIDGNDNNLTVDTAMSAGARDLDIYIEGDDNDWTVNAGSSTSSTVVLAQTGHNVTGRINQNGVGSNMDLVIDAASTGAFVINTYDTSTSSSASIDLDTLGAGVFDIYQTTDNSVYDVSMTLAAGAIVALNM